MRVPMTGVPAATVLMVAALVARLLLCRRRFPP
jgi:hypothetical protein